MIVATTVFWCLLKSTFLCMGSKVNPVTSGSEVSSNMETNPRFFSPRQPVNGLDANSFKEETLMGFSAFKISWYSSYCLGARFLTSSRSSSPAIMG